MTNHLKDGFHTLTPHIIVKNADRAIEFYKQAFGAKEMFRHPSPDGNLIMHAQLQIGDSILMLCDEFPPQDGCSGWLSPESLKGTPVTLHLSVEDTDAQFKQAIAAGAESKMAPMDAFWGDRYAQVQDPFGHMWSISTHQVDLTPEQIAEASKKAFAS